MEQFWTKIKTSPVNRPLCERLRERTLPLVLWGMGDVGLALFQLLQKEGIPVAAVVVYEAYFKEGTEFCGFRVETFKSVSQRFAHYDVLVGHAAAQRSVELKRIPEVSEVFYVTGLSYGQTEPFSEEFVAAHRAEYEDLAAALADDLSRDCLAAFLSARICDDSAYVWPYAPSRKISYFEDEILKLSDHETYLDIGAYNGDTIEAFLDATGGRYERIIGIEADDHNFARLLVDGPFCTRMCTSAQGGDCIGDCIGDGPFVTKDGSVRLYKIGTWNEETTLFLSEDAEETSVLDREAAADATTKSMISGHEIKVYPLDSFLRAEGLDSGITLYKINFYAGVLETLQGSLNLLKTNRPKIILTVGFDKMALLTLPAFLRENLPDYTYYLRYMQAMPGRLVLYALPMERLMGTGVFSTGKR